MTPTLSFAVLRRPAAVWLAVCIAWLAALAPTLSHARVLLRGGAPDGWVICTSTGSPALQSAAAPDFSTEQQSVPIFEHCPFCLPHTDRALLPLHSQVHRFAVLSNEPVPTAWQAFFLNTQSAFRPPAHGPPTSFAI